MKSFFTHLIFGCAAAQARAKKIKNHHSLCCVIIASHVILMSSSEGFGQVPHSPAFSLTDSVDSALSPAMFSPGSVGSGSSAGGSSKTASSEGQQMIQQLGTYEGQHGLNNKNTSSRQSQPSNHLQVHSIGSLYVFLFLQMCDHIKTTVERFSVAIVPLLTPHPGSKAAEEAVINWVIAYWWPQPSGLTSRV